MRVLVVEDERALADAIARGLRREGMAVDVAYDGDTGHEKATITRYDALPYFDSDYTRRFRFDAHDNPKLKSLRERYQLDAVVAPGRDEFDRQVLLLDWVHRRFNKFGRPTSPAGRTRPSATLTARSPSAATGFATWMRASSATIRTPARVTDAAAPAATRSGAATAT